MGGWEICAHLDGEICAHLCPRWLMGSVGRICQDKAPLLHLLRALCLNIDPGTKSCPQEEVQGSHLLLQPCSAQGSVGLWLVTETQPKHFPLFSSMICCCVTRFGYWELQGMHSENGWSHPMEGNGARLPPHRNVKLLPLQFPFLVFSH